MIKNLINRFLCYIRFHVIDESEWRDVYGWGEEYLYSDQTCKRCNKLIEKKLV